MKKSITVLTLIMLFTVPVVLFQNCARVSFTTASTAAPLQCSGPTCAETSDNKDFYSGVSNKAFDRGRGNTSNVH